MFVQSKTVAGMAVQEIVGGYVISIACDERTPWRTEMAVFKGVPAFLGDEVTEEVFGYASANVPASIENLLVAKEWAEARTQEDALDAEREYEEINREAQNYPWI